MKKLLVPVLFLLLSTQIVAQLQDRLNEITDEDMQGYATPLATWTGTFLNSGGYHSADVSTVFGFKFSILGMMIFIPESQRTFEVDPGVESATFFGDKGAAVPGTAGFLVYPPGVNQTSVPAAIPQVAVSTMGSEVMLRFLPKTKFQDVEADLLGIGVKHSISQYIPLLPVDIAVQVMYNKLSLSSPDLSISTTNLAFNAHASRSFGLVTLYGGLQYEQTKMDIDYVYTGTGSELLNDNQLSVKLDGDNNVRLTAGAALQLAFFVINADVNIGSQMAVIAGINFEF